MQQSWLKSLRNNYCDECSMHAILQIGRKIANDNENSPQLIQIYNNRNGIKSTKLSYSRGKE